MTETQLDRVETMLKKIAPAKHQIGLDFVQQHVAGMLVSMARGKKIDAIYECRTLTGFGLKEAKDLICNALPD